MGFRARRSPSCRCGRWNDGRPVPGLSSARGARFRPSPYPGRDWRAIRRCGVVRSNHQEGGFELVAEQGEGEVKSLARIPYTPRAGKSSRSRNQIFGRGPALAAIELQRKEEEHAPTTAPVTPATRLLGEPRATLAQVERYLLSRTHGGYSDADSSVALFRQSDLLAAGPPLERALLFALQSSRKSPGRLDPLPLRKGGQLVWH